MYRWMDRIESAFTQIAAVLTLLLMLLTSTDAISRYLFGSPIPGAYEFITQYLLVVIVFFAMTYTYRKGAFVRITLFIGRASEPVRRFAAYVAQIVSGLTGVAMVVATAQQAVRAFEGGTLSSGAIKYAIWPAYVLVLVALVLLSAYMLADITRIKSGEAPLFKESHEE